jgi:D-alanyl-lipoteichoic acid acyltransferase DltB (MBOAT superfamily)
MQFNSLAYLIFLVVAVIVYWFLPSRFRRAFVLAASLVFYATWGIVFVAVPFVVCLLVYGSSRWMLSDPAKAGRWMWLGISCALAILIFFKYREFLLINMSTVAAWLSGHQYSFAKTVALPMGISFYTFEAIGFLTDVRQGRVKKVGIIELLLFFMFWPNVMSGPIVRARELVPQLQFRLTFEPRFAFEGIDRVIWGLVQKNVVANVLGIWVDKGFGASKLIAISTVDGWFLAIAFGLQIYFDFAGYSNMAIGTARLLGVTLPENFRQPYHATTPPDFWARWHMTLSRWIRDYLFFPINAKWMGAPLPLYLSMVGVMGLVGLWHGAGWNFLIWGLMHGSYLVLFRMYEAMKAGGFAAGRSRFTAAAWRLLTLIAVTAAWVPFRSPSLNRAGAILASMFTRHSMSTAFSRTFYLFTVSVALLCVIEPVLMRKLADIEEQAGTKGLSLFRIVCRPIAYSCGLLLFMLFDEHNSQFIYSQF